MKKIVLPMVVALWMALLPASAGAATPGFQPIVLQVNTPAYTLDKSGLSVAGYAALDIPGAPALPVWISTVELPADADWVVSYDLGKQIVLPWQGVFPSVPIANWGDNDPQPLQARPDQPASPVLENRPDPAIYGVDSPYPAQVVQVGPEQWQRGRRFLRVQVFPFQVNPQQGQLLYHPAVRVTITLTPRSVSAAPAAPSLRTPAQVDGALRIRTGERGLYRLTYAELQAAGVPLATANPATFALSYRGEPVAIQVTGAADGRFDPSDLVIFYATPYQGRYMVNNLYQFTYGGAAGLRMATRQVTPAAGDPLVNAMQRTVHAEDNLYYYSDYQADHWFYRNLYASASFPVVSGTYPITSVPSVQALGDTATVRINLYSGSGQKSNPNPPPTTLPDPRQSVLAHFNTHELGLYQWEGSIPYTITVTIPVDWINGVSDTITLEAALSQLPGSMAYWFSPNWFELSYNTALRPYQDRLFVEALVNAAGQRARVHTTGWSAQSVAVYDVRSSAHPVHVLTTQATTLSGAWDVDFWDEWAMGAAQPSYFLATPAAFRAPLAIEVDAPSTLVAADNQADYIAIVHASLADAVQPLLTRRAAQGLRVKLVDVQDIYDEFSGGLTDPEAIRSFLSYAYHHWNQGGPPPTYVLLVGDGHYDFKNYLNSTLPNLIPPYLVDVDPTLGETAADNRYACVDGPADVLPDMHLGRISARTPADVAAYVNKVIAYESATPGDWQQRSVFVADNEADPAGNFHAMSDDIRLGWLPVIYEDVPVYFGMDADHDTGAEMRAAIKAEFNRGAAYLQWFGHASQTRWGHYVSMFDALDPATLNANTYLPLTVHMACWSGYFMYFPPIASSNVSQALGEVLLLTPQRGAIADISPTGLHTGGPMVLFNRGLVKALYQDALNQPGAAIDAARLYYYQNAVGTLDVIDTMTLFGDPAIKLRMARSIYLPLLHVR